MPKKPHSSLLNKTVLLINTGNLKKRFILQRLKKLGVTVIAVNKEKNWAVPYVSDWILADTTKHPETIAKVGLYLKNHKVDGILTFWEDDVLLTAKLNDKFGYTGIPFEVAQQARNKFLFREFCRENNLPVPKHQIVENEDDLAEVVANFSFPMVAKPTLGSSSAYVIKVDDEEELRDVYKFMRNNLSTTVESALSNGIAIMVEEYIDGDEVDIDMIVQNGKIKFWSITDNFQTQEPFFIETGMAIPTMLSDQAEAELLAMADMTLEKMGVMNAIIHYEAKYSKHGPVPIEVNLRMGGDEVYEFVKNAWNVDLIENAVKIACGEFIPRIEKPEEPYEYLTSKSFLIPAAGVVSSLDIPDSFPKELRVHDLNFFKEVGDTVLTPPADYDYMGWITVGGDNHNDARDNLEAVMKEISYEIVPFSGISAVGKTERRSPFAAASLQNDLVKGQARIERVRHLAKDQKRKLRIGIACNTYNGADGAVEAELSSVGTNIQNTLDERGYKTTFIDFNHLNKAIDTLEKNKIDFIFNVGERLNNSSLLEPHIASLFDAYQIPYTGSNPFTLGLCIDKIRVKKLLTYHNIPTARWDYAYDLDDEISPDLEYPLIVKPANTDNSIGITNNSVVTNPKELKRQVEYVLTELKRPVLVEEYLEGDEYDVSIMGSESDDLKVLPLSRTIFEGLPQGYWHIYPFESKFADSQVYKQNIVIQRPPKNVSKKLLSLISEIALDTYNILDCHDYGRVEIKLDRDNNPHVLELNPNPSINIGNCLPEVAKLVGMDYGDFLEEIIALAIKRYKNRPPFYHLQPNMGL